MVWLHNVLLRSKTFTDVLSKKMEEIEQAEEARKEKALVVDVLAPLEERRSKKRALLQAQSAKRERVSSEEEEKSSEKEGSSSSENDEWGPKKSQRRRRVLEDSESEASMSEEADTTSEEDEWDEFCSICGKGGQLMCCDGCPRSFHLRCVHLKVRRRRRCDA